MNREEGLKNIDLAGPQRTGEAGMKDKHISDAGITRAMEIREELFTIANSYGGDISGDIAVILHQACNEIARAKRRFDILEKQA
jgi:hypothetical protein